MSKKKCLWYHGTEGVCITEKDVDSDITTTLAFEVSDSLTRKWMKHPKFKENIIIMGKTEEIYPGTVINSVIMSNMEEDMKSDLARWKKKRK